MNSDTYFKHDNYYITDSMLSVLRSNMTNTEYQDALSSLRDEWGGSCYGMASLAVLAKAGLVPYSNYTYGANSLYSMQTPAQNNNIESLINYYYALQMKSSAQQAFLHGMLLSNKEVITGIIDQLKTSPELLVCYQKDNWGGHAVTAFGVTYGSWTKHGASYQGRIEILDPNYSMSYNPDACIYFNTSSYNWTIPIYDGGKLSSAYGAVIDMATSDLSLINNGGYLSGTSSYSYDDIDYYFNLELNDAAQDHEISKVKKSGNGFVKKASAEDDIIPYSLCSMNGTDNSDGCGYILKDGKSGYKITQSGTEKMDAKIYYGDSILGIYSDSANEVIFDPSGYISVDSDSSYTAIYMTSDEGTYPTDWYRMEVAAIGDLALEMKDEGYLISGSDLKDVVVWAANDDEDIGETFTTNFDTVLIGEDDKGDMTASVDTDSNGTYETEIKLVSLEHPDPDDPISGDANGDGILNVRDAAFIARMLSVGRAIELPMCADYNHDGIINVRDAAAIARALAYNSFG